MSYLKIDIRDDFSDALIRKLEAAGPRASNVLANEIARDTTPFVPASGVPAGLYNRVQVVGDRIIYPGPYARYLYYGRVMVDSKTGKGPMKIVGKDGELLAIRFRKGATLKPTTRPLKFNTHHHKDAQSHWFEASKAKNLDKWTIAAGKLVKYEIEE